MAGFGAGRIHALTAGVLRAGDSLDALYGLLHAAFHELIAADDDIDGSGAIAHGGDAVAVAVDLNHQAVRGEGIGGAEIDRGVHGLMQKRRAICGLDFPMPQDVMTGFTQLCVQIHLLDGHAAADGDLRICGNIGEDERGGIFPGGEYGGLKAAIAKLLCDGFKLIHHKNTSLYRIY